MHRPADDVFGNGIGRRQAPGQAGRYASVFTWSANLRHAAWLNRSTGPERSCVSRTSTRLAVPTSTHSPPPFELYVDFRHFRSAVSSTVLPPFVSVRTTRHAA